jgi:mono/diheme cytochrome c family protein
MKRILSYLVWIGLATSSLTVLGCSSEQAPSNNTPPPAATGGQTTPGAPAATSPAAGSPAAGGGSAAPVAASSVGPDGQVLPGWGKWQGKTDPVPNNAQTLAAAKELFLKNCATCHGQEGKGDGPAGLALDPKPRDFTSGEFKYGSQDWQVMRTIWEGVPPPSGMAKWDGRMSEKDAWTLVHYVKSLSNTK